MDERIYKITLADGTEIGNLTMNGNNFISEGTSSQEWIRETCSLQKMDRHIADTWGLTELRGHSKLLSSPRPAL